MPAPKCPYCTGDADLVTGAVIYPRRPDLQARLFWHCQPCNAYVGCHPGTSTPLGRLANAELRQCRTNAHSHFDRIWKSGEWSRRKAYAWLSKTLGLDPKDTHIGMFDVDRCRQVIQACLERR